MNITPKNYAQAWYELLAKAKKDEQRKIIQSALRHIHKNGRLSWLPEILNEIEELENKSSDVENVVATGARELDLEFVKKIVSQILGKDANITQKTNPDLIGGIQLETKNKRWDLSVRGQLASLGKHLS